MVRAFLALIGACSFLAWSLPTDAGGDLKLTNLEKINTDAYEDDPFVSTNSLTLLYATNRAGTFDIYVARRSGAGVQFSAGKPHLASKEDDERCPFLLPGLGNTFDLYYATNHVPDEKLKDLKNFDLVRRRGEMAPLPLLQISEKEDEMHPWLTAGGREFFFSRKTKEGWVMFVAAGSVPGPGKEVGFPPGYCRATMNLAALTMYMQGPLEGGRTGIFRAKRAKIGGAWSKPEPITILDHPEAKRGAMSPCVRDDRLYFASDRPGGKGGLDIWSAPLAQLK